MKKVKIRIIATLEFQVNPEYYPKEFTAEDILAYEMYTFKESPLDILEVASITSKGELING